MKKIVLNLGNTLNRKEQKEIFGGILPPPPPPPGLIGCAMMFQIECESTEGCFWGSTPEGKSYCTEPM